MALDARMAKRTGNGDGGLDQVTAPAAAPTDARSHVPETRPSKPTRPPVLSVYYLVLSLAIVVMVGILAILGPSPKGTPMGAVPWRSSTVGLVLTANLVLLVIANFVRRPARIPFPVRSAVVTGLFAVVWAWAAATSSGANDTLLLVIVNLALVAFTASANLRRYAREAAQWRAAVEALPEPEP